MFSEARKGFGESKYAVGFAAQVGGGGELDVAGGERKGIQHWLSGQVMMTVKTQKEEM